MFSRASPIAEKDVDAEVLWTWSYPTISEAYRQVILRKCCLKTDKEEIIAFCFGQFNKQWFHIYTSEVKNSDALNKVGSDTITFVAEKRNLAGTFTSRWGRGGKSRLRCLMRE